MMMLIIDGMGSLTVNTMKYKIITNKREACVANKSKTNAGFDGVLTNYELCLV